MIIPFFIPELACPNRCVFCNQHTISGEKMEYLDIGLIKPKIEKYLSTYKKNSNVEVAFFGGNFTGIPIDLQQKYLAEVKPFIKDKTINSIRISTRPDYINTDILNFLKENHVKTIEIGAQSFSDDVLLLSGRGHTASDTIIASEMIVNSDFDLGLQMMLGLPGDTPEKSIATANKIVELGAKCTRIYPTLILKNTELEKMYLSNKYVPLTIQQAAEQAANIVPVFTNAEIKIMRIGLHPSSELQNHSGFLEGPYHVAFGEIVYSKVWNNFFKKNIQKNKNSNIIITVNKSSINAAVGHCSENKKMLLKSYKSVVFKTSENLKPFEYYVDFC